MSARMGAADNPEENPRPFGNSRGSVRKEEPQCPSTGKPGGYSTWAPNPPIMWLILWPPSL